MKSITLEKNLSLRLNWNILETKTIKTLKSIGCLQLNYVLFYADIPSRHLVKLDMLLFIADIVHRMFS